jgi:hypothetical protein
MFGEWYQKTNKTEDTNKLTLLAFKIIAILHNYTVGNVHKLLETVSKGLFRNRSQNSCQALLDCRRTACGMWCTRPPHTITYHTQFYQPKPKLAYNSEGTDELPEDGTQLPKHVGAAK